MGTVSVNAEADGEIGGTRELPPESMTAALRED